MRLIVIALSLFLSTSVIAAPSDFCDRLIGNWHGTYFLKDKAECKKSHGCAHGLRVQVSRASDCTYHGEATGTHGLLSAFDLTCKDNTVTTKRHRPVQLNCTSAKHLCTMSYENDKATVMLVNLRL